MVRFPWVRLAAVAAAALLLSSPPATPKSLRPDPVPDAWQRPHADGANTGYANVVTAPAAKPARTVPNLGTFAPGAGPVIGADGTVYVGNMQGKLMAFHADGSPAWSRQLDAGQQILASPVIGSDGGIYVIGQKMVTDPRVDPPFIHPDSTLHKFLPGGGYAFQVPFPLKGANQPVPSGHGGTSAAPNIWRFNGEEAVIVPVTYPNRVTGGFETRLIAFSTTGPAVIGDAYVSTYVQHVTGSGPALADCDRRFFCIVPGKFRGHGADIGFEPNGLLPEDIRAPLPTTAIYTLPGGGTPWIVVSDGLQDIVGFTFSGQSGFFEGFRARDDTWILVATPMVMPADAETFAAEAQGIIRWRGLAIKQPPRSVLNNIGAAAGPSRTADDNLVFVGLGAVYFRRPTGAVTSTLLPGESIVSAAVSQKHAFVSTANSFLTFDAGTMAPLGRFDWLKGGTSPPAIGPTGSVYAIAGSTLHVFGAPLCDTCPGQAPVTDASTQSTGAQPLAPVQQPLTLPTAPDSSQSAATPATPGQSHFENPRGPHGLRLYACTEVGGEDCGKSVAKAFCQAQGWAKADKYDTKSKKIQAETLTGETCDKNKCKVFDFINCEN